MLQAQGWKSQTSYTNPIVASRLEVPNMALGFCIPPSWSNIMRRLRLLHYEAFKALTWWDVQNVVVCRGVWGYLSPAFVLIGKDTPVSLLYTIVLKWCHSDAVLLPMSKLLDFITEFCCENSLVMHCWKKVVDIDNIQQTCNTFQCFPHFQTFISFWTFAKKLAHGAPQGLLSPPPKKNGISHIAHRPNMRDFFSRQSSGMWNLYF